ncbi:MAG: glutamine-hydrolyzing carbamoyl-phosphate synthase small subunit, partial [Planctomycetota bacterium]
MNCDPTSASPTIQSPHGSARLALEDGSVFVGRAFGDTSAKSVEGEACFNTSLSGYQEVVTDPSYAGQIVTMTCPLIGNYGVNPGDLESAKAQASGFVVRELANTASNYRATAKLEEWLAEEGVTGIAGIDTRALTRRLRTEGALRGVLCTDAAISDEQLVAQAKASSGLVGRNLVATVSRAEPLAWSEDLGDWLPLQGSIPPIENRLKVVALDCGAKLNILRNLTDSGCDMTVLPYDTTPEQIAEHAPDGLFVSNGPGDPSAVQPTIDHLQQLIGKLPIFGICLGHQLLSRAMGADTFKLKFGHRGGNQPVQNLGTQKVEITSQNHGFAVDPDSLAKVGGEPTHINLNDKTLEGFRHTAEPVFAVQYHPESSPGPHDSRYLFDCFAEMMRTGVSPDAEKMDAAQRKRISIA